MSVADLKKSLGAVSVPAVALVVLGLAVIYLLGRWDSSIDTALAAYNKTVDLALDQTRDYRAWRDSMLAEQAAREAEAAERDRTIARQGSAIARMRDRIAEDSTVSARSSVAELLEGLHLRPIHRGTYGTDSAGVRFLEGLRLQALKAPLVDSLIAQRDTLKSQIETVREALGIANTRADSADAWHDRLTGLLEEGQKVRGCRIAGFIPCPSRPVIFVGGLVIGGTTVAIIRRE